MNVLSFIRPRVSTEYREFIPPRRPEEFVGLAGPHFGLALEPAVLEAIAKAKIERRAHPYLVRGEWVGSDGVRFLDVAVDRSWVTNITNYELIEGQLRWRCSGCGKLSGNHQKGCEYR